MLGQVKEPTLEEKYAWLCTKFNVHAVDPFECDALLSADRKFQNYFQFSQEEALPISVDRAIVLVMQDIATNQP